MTILYIKFFRNAHNFYTYIFLESLKVDILSIENILISFTRIQRILLEYKFAI